MKQGEFYQLLANLRRAPGGGLAQLWDVLTTISDNESVWHNISYPLLGLLTVDGDIIRRSGGFVVRLPIGGAGEVLTVVWGVPTWAAPAGGGATESCRVYYDIPAGQFIPAAVVTPLAFNVERFDTDGMHDNVVNNTRITINTAGKYLIGGNIQWQSGTGGGSVRQILVRLNGSLAVVLPGAVQFQAAAAGSFRINVNCIWDSIVGDYFELCAHHTDATDPLRVNTEPGSPEFWAHRLS